MLIGYLNYPNYQVTAHFDVSCGDIHKMHKTGQRNIRIDPATFSNEIQRFTQKEYHFSSEPDSNDMWLEIDFGDLEFELAVFDSFGSWATSTNPSMTLCVYRTVQVEQRLSRKTEKRA